MMLIRFYKTYEPVTSFYRDLLPYLADQGIETEVVISRGEYRKGFGQLEEALSNSRIRISRIPAGKINTRGGP